MGQRSQIYIIHNGELVVANYYQWNYGERMISRAKYLLERIKDDAYIFNEYRPFDNTIAALADINFDMKDRVQSIDILKCEINNNELDKKNVLSEILFEQGNNDGKLLIVVNDEDVKDFDLKKHRKIKYAFLDYDGNLDNPMNARGYLLWNFDCENDEELETKRKEFTCYNKTTFWGNIKFINKFELLSTEELEKVFDPDNLVLPLKLCKEIQIATVKTVDKDGKEKERTSIHSGTRRDVAEAFEKELFKFVKERNPKIKDAELRRWIASADYNGGFYNEFIRVSKSDWLGPALDCELIDGSRYSVNIRTECVTIGTKKI